MIPGPVVDDRATKGAANLCPDMAIIGWKDPEGDAEAALPDSRNRSLIQVLGFGPIWPGC